MTSLPTENYEQKRSPSPPHTPRPCSASAKPKICVGCTSFQNLPKSLRRFTDAAGRKIKHAEAGESELKGYGKEEPDEAPSSVVQGPLTEKRPYTRRASAPMGRGN